jgi:NADPH:quinone reductase-like Zn-dependent oxidoreductase
MRSLRLDRQRQLIFRIRLGSVYLVSRKAANAGNHLSPLRLTRCSQCEELDKPVPAPGEVLIQVRAALVNPYDWHFLRGAPSFIRLFTALRRPKSPSLGSGCGRCGHSSWPRSHAFQAWRCAIRHLQGSICGVCLRQRNGVGSQAGAVCFEQAALAPIAGITALQGLRDSGRVQLGQRVLIGAAGGVGAFAVQIGKLSSRSGCNDCA